MRINIGGVVGEKPNFKIIGLDPEADIKHDLNKYPYPFKNNSVDEIWASHVIEHLKEPYDFMKECYRIMKKGSIMTIKVPHCTAIGGAYGSFEHRWHVNELAIRDFTGQRKSSIFPYKFTHISTKVKRGRFLKWQKREIMWVIQK